MGISYGKKTRIKDIAKTFRAHMGSTRCFEIRYNDRGYKVGDLLLLREWSLANGYSGREITLHITYIFSDFGLKENWLVMSIDVLCKQ